MSTFSSKPMMTGACRLANDKGIRLAAMSPLSRNHRYFAVQGCLTSLMSIDGDACSPLPNRQAVCRTGANA
jgi:hypothetical protein